MYSLNVPLPGGVERLAADRRGALLGCDRLRDDHTLLAKRLGSGPYARTEKRARRALDGPPAFEARIAGVDAFEEPARGPGPVVYLAVESPGLCRLHRRLCEAFEPVEGIEGEGYVPHVTLARGCPDGTVERLEPVEPVTWDVTELHLYDARHGEVAGRIRL